MKTKTILLLFFCLHFGTQAYSQISNPTGEVLMVRAGLNFGDPQQDGSCLDGFILCGSELISNTTSSRVSYDAVADLWFDKNGRLIMELDLNSMDIARKNEVFKDGFFQVPGDFILSDDFRQALNRRNPIVLRRSVYQTIEFADKLILAF